MLNLLNMNIIKILGDLEFIRPVIYSVKGVRRREGAGVALESHLPLSRSFPHNLQVTCELRVSRLQF